MGVRADRYLEDLGIGYSREIYNIVNGYMYLGMYSSILIFQVGHKKSRALPLPLLYRMMFPNIGRPSIKLEIT